MTRKTIEIPKDIVRELMKLKEENELLKEENERLKNIILSLEKQIDVRDLFW